MGWPDGDGFDSRRLHQNTPFSEPESRGRANAGAGPSADEATSARGPRWPARVRARALKKPPRKCTDEERFWRKVQVRGADRCWPWLAGKRRRGYGAFWMKGALRSAHHVALELMSGVAVPESSVVMHSCDTPTCCNPKHLSLATQLANVRDMHAKGRAKLLAGREHWSRNKRKLSAERVAFVRSEYANGATLTSIAKQLDVALQTVSDIVNSKTHRGVGLATETDGRRTA